ncbi:stalk domain-containing protein [Bacillus tianshenii]|nr:stalk domain-containing protein [Bacillus tianshenii]
MKKRIIALAGFVGFLFAFSLGVGAAPALEKVSSYLNWSLNFKVDGQNWTPTDQNGDKLSAITYNNRTYLPVRAVGEAVGTAVDYDAATKTVILGKTNTSASITAAGIDTGAYAMTTQDKRYTVQNGTDYGSGVVLEGINSAEKDFTLQPNGKYQSLSLTVFGLGEERVRVKIYDENDTVLKDFTVSAGSSEAVSVNIGSAKNIRIGAESSPGADDSIFVTGSYQ